MQAKGAGVFPLILVVMALATFMGVALAQQIVPTPDPLALTATEIIARATKAGLTFGTAVPHAQATETWSAYAATRTTIALTRRPQLPPTSTSNNSQLTATQIEFEFNLTGTSLFQFGTPDYQALRATHVQQETQTASALTQNPSLALTIPPCRPLLGILYDPLTSEGIQDYLDQADLETRVVVDVVTDVIDSCGQGYAVVGAELFIRVEAADLEDEEQLAKFVEEILGILTSSPSRVLYSPETTRLKIVFWNRLQLRDRLIETGYDNALHAYSVQGLRGEALIEALGTLSPLY